MFQTPTVNLSGANTTDDATGSNVYELFKAEQHCYVKSVVCQPLGDNAATNFRVYHNNGKSEEVGSNNGLVGGAAMAQTSSTGNATYEAASTVSLDLYMKPGDRLLCTIGVAATDGFDAHAKVAPHYRDFNV